MLAYMLHIDILYAVFGQLTPCEETFTYMMHLMLVCKTWKSAVKQTCADTTWLGPYIQQCKSYYAALKTVRNQEVLHTFVYGMKAYKSCRNVQEQIMRTILVPTVAGIAEQERVRGAQIVSVAVEDFIPHALHVSRGSRCREIFSRAFAAWCGDCAKWIFRKIVACAPLPLSHAVLCRSWCGESKRTATFLGPGWTTILWLLLVDWDSTTRVW